MPFLTRIGKTFKIVTASLLVLIALVFFFISPLLEYVVEKNSKEWLGRVIKMDNLDLNIFNGKLSITGIKMLEPDDKTTFFSCGNILVNFTVYKLIAGDYTISEVAISKPYIKIVRSPKGFNFDDLTASDSTSNDAAKSEPVHFNVENITISNGNIDYWNSEFENNIMVTDFKVHSDGIAWDDKGTKADIAFGLAEGGTAAVKVAMDYQSKNYWLNVNVDQLSLGRLKPYIYDFLSISDFNGFLSCNLDVKGNANVTTDIALSGILQLDDILLTGSKKDSLIAIENFSVGIDSVNLKNNVYRFSHVTMENPYILYEVYDNDMDNFSALMPTDSGAVAVVNDSIASSEETTNPFVMMSDFGKQINGSYDMNSYKVDSFLISGGKVVYNDYTLLETFSYHLTDLKISSNSLDSKVEKVEIEATAGLNYSGKFEALLSYDPKNYKDMDLYYRINGMRISDLSPHSNYYVAHPFYDGVVNYESKNSIRNMILDSKNNLLIEKMEVGSRIDNKIAYDVPLKMAVALLKDIKGNIDLEIPVSGDLNDPEYKIGKVIWQVISNILIKAVTAPYRLIANSLSVDEEDIKQINFHYLDTTFTSKQFKSIDALKKVLDNKTDLTVQIAQYTNIQQEQEQYASWESRKQFWFEKQGKTIPDSLDDESRTAIETLTVKDSLFGIWLDTKLGPQEIYTPVQQKILQHIGAEKTRVAVQEMEKKRISLLQNYAQQTGMDSARYTIYTEAPEKIPASEALPKFQIIFGVAETPAVEK